MAQSNWSNKKKSHSNENDLRKMKSNDKKDDGHDDDDKKIFTQITEMHKNKVVYFSHLVFFLHWRPKCSELSIKP